MATNMQMLKTIQISDSYSINSFNQTSQGENEALYKLVKLKVVII